MRTSSMTFRATTILFLLAALGYLYRFLFIVPFLPVENNGIADSLLYLAPGQRMLEGDLIYRDVFEYLTPGTALVNFFMFKLFGLRLWIPDLLALLLGLGIIWLGVVISRKMMRPGLTLLPSALFSTFQDAHFFWIPLIIGTCSGCHGGHCGLDGKKNRGSDRCGWALLRPMCVFHPDARLCRGSRICFLLVVGIRAEKRRLARVAQERVMAAMQLPGDIPGRERPLLFGIQELAPVSLVHNSLPSQVLSQRRLLEHYSGTNNRIPCV